MKTLRVKILPLTLFILISATFVFAQPENKPKAIINLMTYDIGEIIQDSIVTIYYVITNEGSELLKITKVSASCGCTEVMPEKNKLGPNESTKIKVTFNSKDRLGKQNKIISVHTNDPNNSIMRLTLKGNVLKSKST